MRQTTEEHDENSGIGQSEINGRSIRGTQVVEFRNREPDPGLRVKLDSLGYRSTLTESGIAFIPPSSRGRGRGGAVRAFGPMARRALDDIAGRGNVEPPGSGQMFCDGTPWGRAAAGIIENGTRLGREVRVAVDGYALPRVVDRWEPDPVVVVHDRLFSSTRAVEAALHMGFTAVPMAIHDDLRKDAERIARNASMVILPESLFVSSLDRAIVLARIGVGSVPVVADHLRELGRYLGDETLRQVESQNLDILRRSVFGRDLSGVALRRVLLVEHNELAVRDFLGAWNPFEPPHLSVVTAVDGPKKARRILNQMATQTYSRKNLIMVVKAGEAVATERLIRESAVEARIHQVVGEKLLSESLDSAIERIEGGIVSIWDSSAFYGPNHLLDMVQALRWSNASLVGKAGEFRYQKALGMTTQSSPQGRYRDSRALAAGTLTLRRSTWAEIGGIGDSVRPASLIDKVLRSRGRVYRTHGYGFLSVGSSSRRGVAESIRQWPGRATVEAEIECGEPRLARRFK